MRSTDEVIAALVADLRPVTPLRRWPLRMAAWAVTSATVVSVSVVALGLLLQDVSQAEPTGSVDIAGGLLPAAALVAASAALRRGIPGDARATDAWSVAPFAVWALMLASALGGSAWPGLAGSLDWTCVGVAVTACSLPATLLAGMVGRSAPTGPVLTGVLVGTSAASVGALTAHLACASRVPWHVVVSHALPALCLVVAVGFCSTIRHRSRDKTCA